jgi:hypothetical protein
MAGSSKSRPWSMTSGGSTRWGLGHYFLEPSPTQVASHPLGVSRADRRRNSRRRGTHGERSLCGEPARAAMGGKKLHFFSPLHAAFGTPQCCNMIFWMLQSFMHVATVIFWCFICSFFMLQLYVYSVSSLLSNVAETCIPCYGGIFTSCGMGFFPNYNMNQCCSDIFSKDI